jgi:hypothetical protein
MSTMKQETSLFKNLINQVFHRKQRIFPFFTAKIDHFMENILSPLFHIHSSYTSKIRKQRNIKFGKIGFMAHTLFEIFPCVIVFKQTLCYIIDTYYLPWDSVLSYTAKPVYNDHPWDPKIVAVVRRWSLFNGHLSNKCSKWDLKMVVFLDRWSQFGDGRQLRFDCTYKYVYFLTFTNVYRKWNGKLKKSL